MKIRNTFYLLLLITLFYACQRHNQPSSPKAETGSSPLRFTEVQTYRLKKGVSLDSFLVAVKSVNLFLDEQPGFMYRTISMTDSGVVEVVHWASHDAFSKAQEKAFTDARTIPFFSFIDEAGAAAYFGDEKLIYSKVK